MKFGSFNGGDGGELTSVSLVEISEIFATENGISIIFDGIHYLTVTGSSHVQVAVALLVAHNICHSGY